MTKKYPTCVSPLVFDGLMCKYNKTMEIGDKDYLKVWQLSVRFEITFQITVSYTILASHVSLRIFILKTRIQVYYKQALLTATYNFTLSRVGYRRPADMSDNPPEFLMRHLVKHPYQVCNGACRTRLFYWNSTNMHSENGTQKCCDKHGPRGMWCTSVFTNWS